MGDYKVVEKVNHNAVHCITWIEERGLEWIEEYGDSKIFTDKSLTKDSFEVIKMDGSMLTTNTPQGKEGRS